MKNNNFRLATQKDVEGIYNLFCEVQLTTDFYKSSWEGFFPTEYSKHSEETKQRIKNWINDSYVQIYSKNDVVGAILIGFTEERFLKDRPKICTEGGKKYALDKQALNQFGINTLSELKNFSYLERIAVSPEFRRERVISEHKNNITNEVVSFSNSLAQAITLKYIQNLVSNNVKYMLSEVIVQAFDGDKQLPISNNSSKIFHKSIGSIRVGLGPRWNWDQTIIGPNGSFSEDMYILDLNKYLNRLDLLTYNK